MDLTFKGINIDQLSTLLPIIGAQISKPHFQGLHQKVGAILALDKQKTNHAIIDFIDSVCSYTPATGSEYIVYAAISSAIQLLDVASFTHQQKLMNHTFHKWFRDNSLFSEFVCIVIENWRTFFPLFVFLKIDRPWVVYWKNCWWFLHFLNWITYRQHLLLRQSTRFHQKRRISFIWHAKSVFITIWRKK